MFYLSLDLQPIVSFEANLNEYVPSIYEEFLFAQPNPEL
jgi:hypothetical protein